MKTLEIFAILTETPFSEVGKRFWIIYGEETDESDTESMQGITDISKLEATAY